MYDKYSKIPSFVKNHTGICSNAKLLYGDILLLCHTKGYCYANNKFLGSCIKVSERTITRLLGELESNDLIIIEYCKNQRKIYLTSRVDANVHLG